MDTILHIFYIFYNILQYSTYSTYFTAATCAHIFSEEQPDQADLLRHHLLFVKVYRIEEERAGMFWNIPMHYLIISCIKVDIIGDFPDGPVV